jgi:diacylglycerol kinase family enzyme
VTTQAPEAPIWIVANRRAGVKPDPHASERLTELFQAANVSVRIVTPGSPAESEEAARAGVAAGARAVVAAGGDGTVHTVASALVGSETPLGVLPLGTLNHFAKDLGIPIDLDQAVATIAGGRVTSVDVGQVNDRIFVNNSSIGLYPNIVIERERLRSLGYRKWTAFAVASMRILRRYRGVVVRLELDNRTETVRTPFLFVGNNEYQIDGIRMGGRTRLDRGQLFACLAPRIHTRDLPKVFARAVMGRAGPDPLESFDTRELHVETLERRRIRVALDGEVVSMRTPLAYRVRPLALKVLVPGE